MLTLIRPHREDAAMKTAVAGSAANTQVDQTEKVWTFRLFVAGSNEKLE